MKTSNNKLYDVTAHLKPIEFNPSRVQAHQWTPSQISGIKEDHGLYVFILDGGPCPFVVSMIIDAYDKTDNKRYLTKQFAPCFDNLVDFYGLSKNQTSELEDATLDLKSISIKLDANKNSYFLITSDNSHLALIRSDGQVFSMKEHFSSNKLTPQDWKTIGDSLINQQSELQKQLSDCDPREKNSMHSFYIDRITQSYQTVEAIGKHLDILKQQKKESPGILSKILSSRPTSSKKTSKELDI